MLFQVCCLILGCLVSTVLSGVVKATAIPTTKYCDYYQSYMPFGMECTGIWSSDTDGDLKVSEEELYQRLKSVYPDRNYFRAYFIFRDLNFDGVFDRQDEPILFDRMDTDHSGDVHLGEYFTEYQLVRREVPYVIMSQPDYIKNISNTFTEMDKYGLEHLFSFMPHAADGSVAKKDFVSIFTNKFSMMDFESKAYFKTLDTNGDDVISPSELGDKFSQLDKNGDKKLELGEIIKLAVVPDFSG